MMGFRIMWYDRWVSFRKLGLKMSSEGAGTTWSFFLAVPVNLKPCSVCITESGSPWVEGLGSLHGSLQRSGLMSLDIPASGKMTPKPLGNLRERKAIQTLLTHFLEDMPFTDHSDLCSALAVPMGYPSAACYRLPTASPQYRRHGEKW